MLNDQEFFGLNFDQDKVQEQCNKNFPINTVKDIAQFLNKFVYKFIITEKDPDYKNCQKSIIHILNDLYNRDQRKQFQQPECWIIPEVNLDQFNQFNFGAKKDNQDYIQSALSLIPHIFTFERRVQKLRQMIEIDQKSQDRNPFQFYEDDEDDEYNLEDQYDKKFITVRRGYELADSMNILYKKNMKSLFKVKFINQLNMEEEGIDGGGLLKELITKIIRQAFDPNYGYFIEAKDKTLMPNPQGPKDQKEVFFFLGKVVGKAIYENILIEPVFSRLFLNHMIGKKNNLEELQFYDEELYKNLMQIKRLNDQDLEQMELYFAINEQIYLQDQVIELKKGGTNIKVTKENKLEYIQLYADWKLNKQFNNQAAAFSMGFQQVISADWLNMFNHQEIQLLISGKYQHFDIEDLRQNTTYTGYKVNDLTIQCFWNVLEEFTDEEKAKFLYFVTSCSRPPTLGFKSLDPKFQIQYSVDEENEIPEKLPTSSTCMNILKLPNYQDPERLRDKLLQAITSGAGFDLS